MIRIGIPSAFMYPDPSRNVFGQKSLCYLEKDMGTYLYRPGVLPVMIPDLPKDGLYSFLQQMDGFVFQGGTDMAPASYGATPIKDGVWPGDPVRDEFELEIMAYAMRHEKPILGICRGFQVMNAHFGGTLFQDIDLQIPGAIQHRHTDLYDQLIHPVELKTGKILEKLYKDHDNWRINSVHHQAIDQLGKDLEVTATCPQDGVIEAINWLGAPEGKVMGVQWHPEFFYNSREALLPPEPVYEHFLKFCK